MKHPRQSSRDLGLRSFGSFGNRPILKSGASGIFRKPKAGKIHNYPYRREMDGK